MGATQPPVLESPVTSQSEVLVVQDHSRTYRQACLVDAQKG